MNRHIDDNYWIKMVDQVAEASTCRVKVGCVIIYNKEIMATGFVGSISGDYHCEDIGCLFIDNHGEFGSGQSQSCIRTSHAEMNAVFKCMKRGSIKDGWLISYSTFSPCLHCFHALLSIGVRTFIFKTEYKDLTRQLCHSHLHTEIDSLIIFKQISK